MIDKKIAERLNYWSGVLCRGDITRLTPEAVRFKTCPAGAGLKRGEMPEGRLRDMGIYFYSAVSNGDRKKARYWLRQIMAYLRR